MNGSVVLARYGKVFRGNKVHSAQIRGAVAVIIFSDPADQGSEEGTVYPNGPWRPASGTPPCLASMMIDMLPVVSYCALCPGLQRGSVYLGEGDPLTPFFPATNDSLRLSLNEARDSSANGTGAGWALPLIPSIPISALDAAPIMAQLVGLGSLVSRCVQPVLVHVGV